MDWNRVEGNWKEVKGKVKEKWGKLTDDDLTAINGQRDQLEGRLQQRYGYAKDQAASLRLTDAQIRTPIDEAGEEYCVFLHRCRPLHSAACASGRRVEARGRCSLGWSKGRSLIVQRGKRGIRIVGGRSGIAGQGAEALLVRNADGGRTRDADRTRIDGRRP